MSQWFIRRVSTSDGAETSEQRINNASVPAAKKQCRTYWEKRVKAVGPGVVVTLEIFHSRVLYGRETLVAKLSGRYGDVPEWQKPV